jgi:uncharacterized membrane protein YhaH (DUF805 family)
MKWFLDVLKNKYATSEGRARRSEYWYYVLFYVLAIVALAIIDQPGANLFGPNPKGVLGPGTPSPTVVREQGAGMDPSVKESQT